MFSHDEIRRLYGQFGSSRNASPDVQDAYGKAGCLPLFPSLSLGPFILRRRRRRRRRLSPLADEADRRRRRLPDEADRAPSGKRNLAKQKLLMAWIKDPELGDGFWKVCATIGVKETLKQQATWQPWKYFVDKYGESEAEEMKETGRLKALLVARAR